MKRFELSIDHPALIGAKAGFDTCLKMAIAKAISTGSMEGSAKVTVKFELAQALDKDTGEYYTFPIIKYNAGFSVPMKESIDGTVAEKSRIIQDSSGEYVLINGQISMDELIKEEVK